MNKSELKKIQKELFAMTNQWINADVIEVIIKISRGNDYKRLIDMINDLNANNKGREAYYDG